MLGAFEGKDIVGLLAIAAFSASTAYLAVRAWTASNRWRQFLSFACGCALSSAFIYSNWLVGLLVGTLFGFVVLPNAFLQAVTTLPLQLTGYAIGMGFAGALVLYVALRGLKLESLAIVVSIFAFSGLSTTLAERLNRMAIIAAA